MVQADKFWDKAADKYSRSPIRNEAQYQEKLKITRSYFESDMEVLELACGTGTTAISHAPFVKHILAVDVSSKMLELAQSKADAAGVANISFEKSSIDQFERTEKSFDVVMAHNILHLLENPSAALDKIYSLLKPGGVFVSSTVCLADSKVPWGIVIAAARLLGLAPYVKSLKRDDFLQCFARSGFDIEVEWDRRKSDTVFIVARRPVVGSL